MWFFLSFVLQHNRTSFVTTFVPMSYLAFKCLFLFLKQTKLLKKINDNKPQIVNDVKEDAIKLPVTSSKSHVLRVSTNDTNMAGSNLRYVEELELQSWCKVSTATPSMTPIPSSPRTSTTIESNTNSQLTTHGTPANVTQQLFNNHQSSLIQKIISSILICISLLYLVFGIVFIISIFTHFSQSQQQCSNYNLNSNKHFELNFWDQCIYKTYPFKSVNFLSNNNNNEKSITCNCRQVKIDLSLFDSYDENYTTTGCKNGNNLCLMFESMLINWDMLEIIYISDNSSSFGSSSKVARFSISLNDSSHYNSIYLKILHLSHVTINSLGISIDKWKNLEYLYISNAHFDQWPSTFDQLSKISFLKLQDSYLQSLPSNLCSMKNLRAINIEQNFGYTGNDFQFTDCIVNLNELQSIIVHFGNTNYLPTGIFSMPSLKEVGFMFDQSVGVDVFLNTINRSLSTEGTFTWNKPSDTTYSFLYSLMCTEMISGIGFTNSFDDLPNIDILKQFLNQTGACDEICSETFDSIDCHLFNWQNGVCDNECNVAACSYDGGDCNQLCQYNSPDCNTIGLFNNGICDIGCNTSYCDYDKYECINFELNIHFDNNLTYCNSNVAWDNNNLYNKSELTVGLCKTDWVNDKWCDNNCRISDECFNDGDDCQCIQDTDNENFCQTLLDAIETLFGISETDNSIRITIDNICSLWTWLAGSQNSRQTDALNLESFLMEYYSFYIQFPNCTMAFEQLDINDDDYLVLSEMLGILDQEYGFTDNRASQINCSFAWFC